MMKAVLLRGQLFREPFDFLRSTYLAARGTGTQTLSGVPALAPLLPPAGVASIPLVSLVVLVHQQICSLGYSHAVHLHLCYVLDGKYRDERSQSLPDDDAGRT